MTKEEIVLLVPVHSSVKSDRALSGVPIHKWGFFSKEKEIKRLRGGVACYAAPATAPIDAEIGKIDHLWMETS